MVGRLRVCRYIDRVMRPVGLAFFVHLVYVCMFVCMPEYYMHACVYVCMFVCTMCVRRYVYIYA